MNCPLSHRRHQLQTIISILLLCLFLSPPNEIFVSSKHSEGYDLEPAENIRIGVKKRVDAKNCK